MPTVACEQYNKEIWELWPDDSKKTDWSRYHTTNIKVFQYDTTYVDSPISLQIVKVVPFHYENVCLFLEDTKNFSQN